MGAGTLLVVSLMVALFIVSFWREILAFMVVAMIAILFAGILTMAEIGHGMLVT